MNCLDSSFPRKGKEVVLDHSWNIFQERHAVGKMASMYHGTPSSRVVSTLLSTKKGSVRTVWPARVSST